MGSKGKFRFHVAPTSGVPIYRQIMDQVRAQIATGRLVGGDFLPSVREVGLDLAVNPMTVSKAYSILERDGVLEIVRGHGMRVAAQQQQRLSDQNGRTEVVQAVRDLVSLARDCAISQDQLRALVDAAYKELERERVRAKSR